MVARGSPPHEMAMRSAIPGRGEGISLTTFILVSLASAAAHPASEAPPPALALRPPQLSLRAHDDLCQAAPEALNGDRAPAASRPQACRHTFLLPAIEVVSFVVLLNLADRALGKEYAEVSGLHDFWRHLWHGPWIFDRDPLFANVFAHPYNGSLYFNFARSSGLSFWWSFAYAFGGSLLWELGGETKPPSINDQVFTSVGGTLLGEALYRSFALILTAGQTSAPGFWRELSAFLVDPAAGFNRLLFRERYCTPEFYAGPPLFMMARAGVGYAWTNNPLVAGGNFSGFAGGGHFELDYGEAADPHFTPQRPFDLFTADLALIGDRQAVRETVRLRGLLGGWRLDTTRFRGLAGIFGNFDDVSAGIFRMAGTSIGAGITGQFGLSSAVALKTTAVLSAILLGAVNTRVPPVKEGYHLGPGGQLELHLRLYLAERSMIELASSEYLIAGNNDFPGTDGTLYARLLALLRLVGPHAVGIAASLAGRVAHNEKGPSYHQGELTATVNYAWISDWAFGRTPSTAAESR
jgi:hypothetical protein